VVVDDEEECVDSGVGLMIVSGSASDREPPSDELESSSPRKNFGFDPVD
jgi:hypothetical protein